MYFFNLNLMILDKIDMNFINIIPTLDISFVYQVISIILSISLMITSLEEMASLEAFHSNGLLSFKISKYNLRWIIDTSIGQFLQHILNDNIFRSVIYIKAISAFVFFILSMLNIISFSSVAFLLLFNILVTIRSPYGLDGAHQLSFLLLLSLTIATFFGVDSAIGITCLYFIAFQLVASYVIAGVAKAISPLWRGPYALLLIFSTSIYGNNFIFYQLKQHKKFATLLSIFIIIFEVGFITTLLLPLKYAIFFCLAGFGFHLFNAIFMGLNNFFFTFIAAYPALIFFIQRVHG